MKHVLIIMTCAIFCCCQFPDQQAAEVDHLEIETAVRNTLEDYFSATRKNGPLAGLAYLDTSEQFFWVPPGFTSAINYDSVVGVIRSFAPAIQSVDNQWVNLEVQALDERSAVFTGEVLSKSRDTAGVQTETRLLETGVVVRREDGWKMLCGQTRVK